MNITNVIKALAAKNVIANSHTRETHSRKELQRSRGEIKKQYGLITTLSLFLLMLCTM